MVNESHNSFSHVSPESYAEVSVLAKLINENMIERLELVTVQPSVILDLGSGTSFSRDALHDRYPEANIVAIDNAMHMLSYAADTFKIKNTSDTKDFLICAEAESLPLLDHSVDLIFANLLLPWCHNWEIIFNESRRVLRKDGLLVFSCLGLDTLRELNGHSLVLKDMHEIGDALIHEKFSDPVMDVEYIKLKYTDYEKMRYELKANAMAMLPVEKSAGDSFTLTFEVVYGHAWGSGKILEYEADDAGVVKVPLANLRRRLNDK